jgi:hypothetical protein
MTTKRCQCGCYVPDRCHSCGRELGELRNESAELAMLRAQNEALIDANRAIAGTMPGPTREHIRRIEAERDDAIAALVRARHALAGQQAIINGRRTGLGEWLREELAVYRGQLRGLRLFHGDWAMDVTGVATLALLVYVLATVAGRLAGGM